jgi:hypothetical protein
MGYGWGAAGARRPEEVEPTSRAAFMLPAAGAGAAAAA